MAISDIPDTPVRMGRANNILGTHVFCDGARKFGSGWNLITC